MHNNIPWQLIISHLKGETDEEEELFFQKWLLLSENATLFYELETLWNDIREEASSYEPDTSYYWKLLENKMNSKGTCRKVVSLRKYRMVVAVASVLLIISLTFSALYGTGHFKGYPNTRLVYSALTGKSKLLLPDSSTVWLNTGSTLEYTSNFSDNREVSLNGEALFDIKKDEQHPFIVNASEMKVKVHGTRFDVKSYPGEDNISVTLFRGSVSVAAGGQETYLHPGEIVQLNKKDKTLNVELADVSFESFWANESIRFEAKSLRYIVRYLEKWYNVKIEVDAAVPDTLAYTFTVKNESLEVILRIMSRINPISYAFDENDHVKITYVKPLKK